jgi:hypothetical protein
MYWWIGGDATSIVRSKEPGSRLIGAADNGGRTRSDESSGEACH